MSGFPCVRHVGVKKKVTWTVMSVHIDALMKMSSFRVRVNWNIIIAAFNWMLAICWVPGSVFSYFGCNCHNSFAKAVGVIPILWIGNLRLLKDLLPEGSESGIETQNPLVPKVWSFQCPAANSCSNKRIEQNRFFFSGRWWMEHVQNSFVTGLMFFHIFCLFLLELLGGPPKCLNSVFA